MNPASTEALSLLSYLYLQHGKADQAVTALEALEVMDPRNTGSYIVSGRTVSPNRFLCSRPADSESPTRTAQ